MLWKMDGFFSSDAQTKQYIKLKWFCNPEKMLSDNKKYHPSCDIIEVDTKAFSEYKVS